MISKSASEYIRRKDVRRDNLDHRESGRIRYQNQHTTLSKQDEAPGMGEFVVFQPNLKSEKSTETDPGIGFNF